MNNGYKTKGKHNYLTNKQIHEIEAAIYNDILETLYTDVSKTYKDSLPQETIKELVKEEEYIHIPEQEEFVLTKSGRVYNIQTVRSICPHFTGRDIRIYLKKRKREYPELFKVAGWEYNTEKILKGFKKNSYNITIGQSQKKYFETL
jgi:hypothetical protein